MNDYQELVVKPLEKLAQEGKGTLHIIGTVDTTPVYAFKGNPKLFATSMHHANEIFGTYNSVIKALSSVPMSGVPVVNASAFDKMFKFLEWANSYSEGKNQNYLFLLEEGLKGYKDLGPDPFLYPPWSKWNYGGSPEHKPPFVTEIEKMAMSAAACLDVHNSGHDHYYTFKSKPKSPEKSELQRELADLVKNTIINNGNKFGEIRRIHGEKTFIDFCADNDIPNICLEVPAFDHDKEYQKVLLDQERIVATNVEIMARMAEHLK